jgi:hypothetical protein
MWTVNDIMDIVREGVPFSNAGSIAIAPQYMNTSDPNSINLSVTFNVVMPLDKVKDISITSGADMTPFFMQLFHPELFQNGNYIYINNVGLGSWFIEDGKMTMSITLNLAGNLIASTARMIRDSNFYSVLDAALSN